MKYLIFSDSHLHSFDEKKYLLLKEAIEQSDRVIINGDFWDGYLTSFETFINSQWQLLFPFLKSRQTVYIYGNHDKKRQSDERVQLFSTEQTQRYKLPVNSHTLVLEHGDRLAPMWDVTYLTGTGPYWQTRLTEKLQHAVVGLLRDRVLHAASGPLNRKIKKKLKEELAKDEIYVCGHTHLAEFSLHEQFINTGFIKYGFAQYLMIDGKSLIPINARY